MSPAQTTSEEVPVVRRPHNDRPGRRRGRGGGPPAPLAGADRPGDEPLVVTVGNTILNVALPTIQAELDAGAGELQWIVDAYLLLFAGLLLAAGSLGDRFGRRRMLMLGLATFGTGSVLAALSSSSLELIASRALMGVGAAPIMPTTLSILTNIFPRRSARRRSPSGPPWRGWASPSGRSRAAG